MEHFFNDTPVPEANYSIMFRVETEENSTPVTIVIEREDDDVWSSVGEFDMDYTSVNFLTYTHEFGTDGPDDLRYYYTFDGEKHAYYWADTEDSKYIYWNFNNGSTLVDNLYMENEGYKAYDQTYIRGEIAGTNGWADNNGLEMTHVESYTWSVTKFLTAGEYEFKFAVSDIDWALTHYPLSSGGNLVKTISTSGSYKIDFNWINKECFFTLLD
ncbi:hypothetical protein EW093_04475 [Thiospirochaeta perfilievii]|uniref:Uncharacterized protein n=1 Tax=Thiospirochaeta perfilievii TaxID=252967 RepID=A0A5C1QB05_9SPIO|nr:hypothetical protein [Thiospirochaeta perfilievii]QEN03986.1 hypothetical protein EW093_04475 [Thiospirochaeta perfilievii]